MKQCIYVLLLVIASMLSLAVAQTRTIQGELQGPLTFVDVLDGKTISIMVEGVQHEVSLNGIDAPVAAKTYLKQLIGGKPVFLEFDVSNPFFYDPLPFAYVYIDNSSGKWQKGSRRYTQMNEELLAAGMANVLAIPPNIPYVNHLKNVLKNAQSSHLGVWRDSTAEFKSNRLADNSFYSHYIPDVGDLPIIDTFSSKVADEIAQNSGGSSSGSNADSGSSRNTGVSSRDREGSLGITQAELEQDNLDGDLADMADAATNDIFNDFADMISDIDLNLKDSSTLTINAPSGVQSSNNAVSGVANTSRAVSNSGGASGNFDVREFAISQGLRDIPALYEMRTSTQDMIMPQGQFTSAMFNVPSVQVNGDGTMDLTQDLQAAAVPAIASRYSATPAITATAANPTFYAGYNAPYTSWLQQYQNSLNNVQALLNQVNMNGVADVSAPLQQSYQQSTYQTRAAIYQPNQTYTQAPASPIFMPQVNYANANANGGFNVVKPRSMATMPPVPTPNPSVPVATQRNWW